MTSLSIPLSWKDTKAFEYWLEADVWKKITTVLVGLVVLSFMLNVLEVFTGLFSVQYAGMRTPYAMNSAELSRNVDYLQARERIFRRMYGKPQTWTPERQAEYNRLVIMKNQYKQRYEKMSASASLLNP